MKSKHRKCKICRVKLPVEQGIINGLDFVCGTDHLAELGLKRVEKQRGKQQKQERKELRERRQAVKTRSQWLREAQAEFNAYIRERDKDLPCVSCGRHHDGQYHAGHYRTVAACSALRFDERQVWKQCAPCNNHKSGNVTEYRIELVRRIGADAVEEVEQTPGLKVGGWTIEEAKAIKAKYRAKCRELKKGA